MISNYQILAITHHQTKLEEIGNFVIRDAEGEVLKGYLEQIKQQFQLDELFYLSTCNRVMYCFVTEEEVDAAFQQRFFEAINPAINFQQAQSHILHFKGEHALDHLLQVSASIDSMVVGEREILRQLRTSYDQCFDWGLTGDHLRLAFRLAIETGKEVYAKTRIGEKPVSVVSLAIQKLKAAHLPADSSSAGRDIVICAFQA